MSRIGKKLIKIPEGIEVIKEDNELIVKGPLGTLRRFFKKDVVIELTTKEIKLSIPENADRQTRILWGSFASHISNMIEGVHKGFEKRLIIQGAGYKAQFKDRELVLNIGFSHPVVFRPPQDVAVKVDKNTLIISGIDKEKVTLAASRLRSLKKPEPYKGKGIRYENEVVRHKAGKKAVSAAA